MTSKKPEDLTLEEIKEQLALYNRLYYQKRRLEKDFMETKRASAMRHHRRKKLDKMLENDDTLNTKEPSDLKPLEDKDENTVKATKPRKYNGTTYNIIQLE